MMSDRKSVCSLRTMCSFMCVLCWLGLAVAAIDPTSASIKFGVPTKLTGIQPNCTNVRTLFESRGLNLNELPLDPVNGELRESDIIIRYSLSHQYKSQ